MIILIFTTDNKRCENSHFSLTPLLEMKGYYLYNFTSERVDIIKRRKNWLEYMKYGKYNYLFLKLQKRCLLSKVAG